LLLNIIESAIFSIIPHFLLRQVLFIYPARKILCSSSLGLPLITDELNIKAERVRQIKTKAEFRLAEEITKRVNIKMETIRCVGDM
jgi:hypothetical protein